jgi:hypothetical protein
MVVPTLPAPMKPSTIFANDCLFSAETRRIGPATRDLDGADQPAEDAFYAWAPNVPGDFLDNYDA